MTLFGKTKQVRISVDRGTEQAAVIVLATYGITAKAGKGEVIADGNNKWAYVEMLKENWINAR